MPNLSRSQLFSIAGLIVLVVVLAALFWFQPDGDETTVRDTNTPDSDILDAPDVAPVSDIDVVDSSELSGINDIEELQDRLVREISEFGDEEPFEYGVVTLE